MALIVMRKDKRKQMMEEMKLEKGLVSNALNFKRNSLQCRNVRVAAVNYYGGLYLPSTCV